jgi:Arc/MetJ-type ribon-helix-helix transcriptional regulator
MVYAIPAYTMIVVSWSIFVSDTEKITINLGVVDLGQIDLLVERGFYSNRTDFIRMAIRNQISSHSDEIKEAATHWQLVIGSTNYDRESLERIRDQGEVLSIGVVGSLVLEDDVTPELALATIKSLRVLGSIRASEEVKEALADRLK